MMVKLMEELLLSSEAGLDIMKLANTKKNSCRLLA